MASEREIDEACDAIVHAIEGHPRWTIDGKPAPAVSALMDRVARQPVDDAIREWNALPWYRRLWYWIFGAPEVEE